MVAINQCPSCGGPIIDAGKPDIRCVNCGLTYFEMVDFFGDDIEVFDEFLGGEDDARELGYGIGEGGEGLESDW